ncbi:MAG TPA: precorrin-6y C5,15-methyltransferase (decarboxylating) subunit CbiE, partial [Pseudonocardiaceae bacterium]
ELARATLADAELVIGSDRQLAMVRPRLRAAYLSLPSPLLPALPALIDDNREHRLCVLASGDPLLFGIGSTLIRLFGPDAVRVLPAVSSASLACARLGWAIEEVVVVSAVGRPLSRVQPAIQPGRRLLILVAETTAATAVAGLLRARGFGPSRMVLLERLGAGSEQISIDTAAGWPDKPHDRLAIVAVDCQPGPTPDIRSTVPGLPDEVYDTDGQLTKREVRALTLSALGPLPGELLWDVGAGTGTVAIEWLRTHPSCRAVAIEPRADRRARIAANAVDLGVPDLLVVGGTAPEALATLPRPDAVFVGGAVSVAGVIDGCLTALAAGGRLVANAVTLEAESTLAAWHARLGGDLTRIALSRAGPLGGFTGWRPAMPVTQWAYRKENRP